MFFYSLDDGMTVKVTGSTVRKFKCSKVRFQETRMNKVFYKAIRFTFLHAVFVHSKNLLYLCCDIQQAAACDYVKVN